MKFNKLAQLFSELEATPKRLEMIDILSEFFKRIKEKRDFEDLDKLIYLLQGQLVPNIKQFPKMPPQSWYRWIGLRPFRPVHVQTLMLGISVLLFSLSEYAYDTLSVAIYPKCQEASYGRGSDILWNHRQWFPNLKGQRRQPRRPS